MSKKGGSEGLLKRVTEYALRILVCRNVIQSVEHRIPVVLVYLLSYFAQRLVSYSTGTQSSTSTISLRNVRRVSRNLSDEVAIGARLDLA